MTLTDLYNKPMKEVLNNCDIVEQKVHTDDNGDVVAIEMKYKPKNGDIKVPSFINNRDY